MQQLEHFQPTTTPNRILQQRNTSPICDSNSHNIITNTPSPKNYIKQKSKLVQSLQSNAVSRKLSTDNEYRRLKLQSPTKSTLNIMPPRPGEPIRNYPSPLKVNELIKNESLRIHHGSRTDQTLNFLTGNLKTQSSNADHLQTDHPSPHQLDKGENKENSNMVFKEIKFNRKNSQARDTSLHQQQKSKSIENGKYFEECTQEISSLTNVENAKIEQFEDYFQEQQREFLTQLQRRDEQIEYMAHQQSKLSSKIHQLQLENDQLRLQSVQKFNNQKLQSQQNELLEQIKGLQNQLSNVEQKSQQQQLEILQLQSSKTQLMDFESKVRKQTQEIDQLRQENQRFQLQQQNMRCQFNQIKELEYMIEVCQSEQDGFVKSLESKESEIQYLKSRIAAQQEQIMKHKQESLKFCYENQQLIQEKAQLESQLKQIEGLNNEVATLKGEIEILESQKRQLQEDHTQCLDQCKRITGINETLTQQYHQIQNENQKLQDSKEEVIAQMTDQIVEMEELINQYKQEIEELNEKNEQITSSYQNQLVELQHQLDEWFKGQIESEIQKVMEPIQAEKDYYALQLEEQVSKNELLKQQIVKTKKENESLYSQHMDLIQQIQECESSCIQMATQRKNQKLQEISQLHEELKSQVEENQSLSKKFKDLVRKCSTLENNIEKLHSDQLTMNAEKIAYETHIVQLKDKLNHLEGEHEFVIQQHNQLVAAKEQSIRYLEDQLQQEQLRLKQQEELYKELQRQADKSESEIHAWEQQLVMKSHQNTNLKLQLDSIKQQNEELKKQYEELSGRYEQIQSLIGEHKQGSQMCTEQMKSLEEENRKLKEQLLILDSYSKGLKADSELLQEQRNQQAKLWEDEQLNMAIRNKQLVTALEEIQILKKKYEEELTRLQEGSDEDQSQQ